MNRKGSRNPNFRHGDTKTRLHKIWTSMKQRCHNPRNYHFANYGGRGIYVYNKWRDDYTKFKEWALNNGYSDELEIDRINNNGPYTPRNCRWTTKSSNCRNTRRNNFLNAFGEVKTLTDWIEDKRCVVGYNTLRSRVIRGTGPELAITSTRIIANQFIRVHE